MSGGRCLVPPGTCHGYVVWCVRFMPGCTSFRQSLPPRKSKIAVHGLVNRGRRLR